jgi:hypothetical protein
MPRKETYEPTITELVKEFAATLEERDKLSVRLVEQLAAIRAMSLLSNEEGEREDYIRSMAERIWHPRPPLKLAVELILSTSRAPMSPVEIKRELHNRGYDLRKYSFAMAGIHSCLKALIKQGAVRVEVLGDGSKMYASARGISNVR